MRKVTEFAAWRHAGAVGCVVLCSRRLLRAADIKLAATAIGRPPIFSNTFVDVGEAMGYWKKAGLDVSFRWFQRGTDTAKAVVTGDVRGRLHRDAAGGQPDRLRRAGCGHRRHAEPGLDRSRPTRAKDCKDLKGKTVAADGINNARYLFLQSVLATCGLKLTDVKADRSRQCAAGESRHRRPGA